MFVLIIEMYVVGNICIVKKYFRFILFLILVCLLFVKGYFCRDVLLFIGKKGILGYWIYYEKKVFWKEK